MESHLNVEFTTGTIEPIERDSLERQMEVVCNQKSSYFTNEDIIKYILHDPVIRGHKNIVTEVPVLPHSSEDVLNAVQREVVVWAEQLKGIGLLAGPPGTGKTHTAAELIYALAGQKSDRPVLVVSSSNAAVDVLLSRVVQCKARQDPDGTVILGRLCSKSHGQSFRDSNLVEYDIASKVIRIHKQEKKLPRDDREPTDADEYESDDCEEFFSLIGSDPAIKKWYNRQMKQELQRCNVIFTTNSLAGSQGMTEIHPRYVIMDESGATPEYAVVLLRTVYREFAIRVATPSISSA